MADPAQWYVTKGGRPHISIKREGTKVSLEVVAEDSTQGRERLETAHRFVRAVNAHDALLEIVQRLRNIHSQCNDGPERAMRFSQLAIEAEATLKLAKEGI